MLNYTIDVLLISLIVVILVGAIKTPIKSVLVKKGLKENEQMKKIFKAIVVTATFILSFVGACLYFVIVAKVNPFKDTTIIFYTIGVIGSTQSIYILFKTYGRDGLLTLIKAIAANLKNKTNVQQLSIDKAALSKVIVEGIQELYAGAPVSEQDIIAILDKLEPKQEAKGVTTE